MMSTPNRSSAGTSKERSYVTSSSLEARDSSETTTVPQLSSSISDNSSSESNIRALRQQLHLVRVQLEQREKELSKYEFISKTEDVHSKKWKKENEIQMVRLIVFFLHYVLDHFFALLIIGIFVSGIFGTQHSFQFIFDVRF
ncbi:hypothetical protein Tcan_02088 [Toxocara canis]|uniref:Uncharacterized protein n=1 Tax=Toxocara canis TaxID=6265 RepID=A0A0B2UL17_TOXCA|nr:hypothetical protein Tcan_02088 [Toxocara canis]